MPQHHRPDDHRPDIETRGRGMLRIDAQLDAASTATNRALAAAVGGGIAADDVWSAAARVQDSLALLAAAVREVEAAREVSA